MREAEEVAKEAVIRAFGSNAQGDGVYTSRSIIIGIMIQALNDYAQAQRAEALEEAAEIADSKIRSQLTCNWEEEETEYALAETRRMIAVGIRALNKPKETRE